MRQIPLGPGGPLVSVLGVGAMSFADFYGATTEENSFAILDAAVEAGVTHVDTANVYGMGRSEETIGKWLKARGGRPPFTIATKASITRTPEGERVFSNDPAHLEAELDKSLSRLGVERVDLFYIHRRDPRFEIEDVTETLAGLIAKGKIASFGFSEIAPASLRRAAAVHPVAAVQSEYSLQTRLPELGLIQACEDLGTTFVAFSPVGRGLLTDRPPSADKVATVGFMRTNPRFSGANLARNVGASEPLRMLGRECGHSAAALAVAWSIAQGKTNLSIPGTRSVAHFAELVDGATMTLSDDLKAEIERRLPAGWCHGGRYSEEQQVGPEQYC